MADITVNLGLKKPLDNESADITIINENIDKIDQAMGPMTTVPTASKEVAGAITELHTAIGNIDEYIPEESVTDAKIGNRTIDDTVVAAAVADTPTRLWSKLANMIKAITGKANWYTAPVKNLEQLNANITAHVADYTLQIPYIATTGSTNTYAVSLSPALTTYIAGVGLAVKINVSNTGASTINVNGLGAKSILDSKGNALTTGKLKLDSVYTLRYNGTAFILQGEGGEYGTAVAANVLAGTSIGTESGIVTGTMPNRAGNNTNTFNGVSGTELWLRAPQGYYDGLDDNVIINDPDFLGAYFRSDINIFGKLGTMPTRFGVIPATGAAIWGDGGLAVYLNTGYYEAGISEMKVSTAQLQTADGDLQPANIRADRNIFGVQGSIPINNGAVYNPSTGNVPIAAGYHSGSVVSGDPEFIASNIVSGVNLWGLAGTATTVTSGSVNSGGNTSVTISGLSFTPQRVVAFVSALSYPTFYNELWLYNMGAGSGTIKVLWTFNADSQTAASGGNNTGQNFTVTQAGGFTLSFVGSGKNVQWYAW